MYKQALVALASPAAVGYLIGNGTLPPSIKGTGMRTDTALGAVAAVVGAAGVVGRYSDEALFAGIGLLSSPIRDKALTVGVQNAKQEPPQGG